MMIYTKIAVKDLDLTIGVIERSSVQTGGDHPANTRNCETCKVK